MEDLGRNIEFDRGGYNEKVENGELVSKDGFFQKSERREFCASKTKSGCLIACVYNINCKLGGPPIDGVNINMYSIRKEPDIDISSSNKGDFSIIDEVRYRDVSEDPIHGTKIDEIYVPQVICTDIELIYSTDSELRINDTWAKGVKKSVETFLSGDDYISPSNKGFERPQRY